MKEHRPFVTEVSYIWTAHHSVHEVGRSKDKPTENRNYSYTLLCGPVHCMQLFLISTPLNKGHIGIRSTGPCREAVLISEVNLH